MQNLMIFSNLLQSCKECQTEKGYRQIREGKMVLLNKTWQNFFSLKHLHFLKLRNERHHVMRMYKIFLEGNFCICLWILVLFYQKVRNRCAHEENTKKENNAHVVFT